MRLRVPLGRLAATGLAVASAWPCAALRAQNQAGAQFLLVPIGAQSVGMGGATVADRLGGEGLLVNPGAIAFESRAEARYNHAQDVRGTRQLLTLTLPSRVLGTFGVSALVSSYGREAITTDLAETVGSFVQRDVALTAAYASTIGSRLGVGLAYRFTQNRTDCTGAYAQYPEIAAQCDTKPSTSMVDVGAQYAFGAQLPLVLGVSLRNYGLRLQIKDRDQSDPLPTRLTVGGRYEFRQVTQQYPELRLHAVAQVSTGIGASGASPALQGGLEGDFRHRFALRGGWFQQSGSADNGPAIGFSVMGGRFAFDLAQQLGGFSVESGQRPVYVAFRYQFR